MACQDLKLGQNEIVLHISEDQQGGNNSERIIGSRFIFGDAQDGATAQYTFTFDVKNECSIRLDQFEYTTNAEAPGTLKFYSQDIETVLIPKIEASKPRIIPEVEEEVDEPADEPIEESEEEVEELPVDSEE